MSRDELPPYTGGKEEFPPYLRVMKTWVAGHKDHSKIEHLLTQNPDGFNDAAKIVVLKALACSQELTQLTTDCPNAVGMVTNAGNPTAAAKVLLDARRVKVPPCGLDCLNCDLPARSRWVGWWSSCNGRCDPTVGAGTDSLRDFTVQPSS